MPEETTMADVENAQPPIGPRITVARENAGLSIDALARRIGVEPGSVAAWERDERIPRANRLQMMAGVLDVNLAWLLLGREDRRMAGEELSLDSVRNRVDRARVLLAEAVVLLEETHAAVEALESERESNAD